MRALFTLLFFAAVFFRQQPKNTFANPAGNLSHKKMGWAIIH